MKATYEIIARRGLEGLLIQDITEDADVGYGSFYNHFPSKEAIIDAVIDAALARGMALHDSVAAQAGDGVETFAMKLRGCLELSQNDTVWGWFVIRTMLSGQRFRAVMAGRLADSIGDGIQAGLFVAEDAEMVSQMICGLLLVGTLKIVNDEAGADYIEQLVETALRSLGVPAEKARAAIALPLPDVAAMPFLEVA